MTEDRMKLGKAYRRASIGLAAVAILWIAAFLLSDQKQDGQVNWLIPIAAAALSIFFYRKSGSR